MSKAQPAPRNPIPGLIVRPATAADNDALITLERETPLVVGEWEDYFDRSPDAFACQRPQGEYSVVLGEVDGRAVAVMAGVIQNPVIQGRPHRLVYIHRARVHPEFHHRGVAWALANHLFSWSHDLGAEGPYYLISAENKPSIAFGGRAGGCWPVQVAIIHFDVAEAREEGKAGTIEPDHLPQLAALMNTSHEGEDFFERLTPESIAERLWRDDGYSINNLYGIFENGRLVAGAGLWDRGATTEFIRVDQTTGIATRSRNTAVVDWGYAPGYEQAFSALLRNLAAETRFLERSSMAMCEPSAGAIPDTGLPLRRDTVSLFTPTMKPPEANMIDGIFVDMLCI